MWDAIRTGSVAIYAADEDRLAECSAFLTRLGGKPDKARVFSKIDALLRGMKKGVDVLVLPADHGLFCDAGYPVFDLARELGLPLATVFDVSIIEPDAARIDALLAADPTAWDPLLDELLQGHLGNTAPRSFMIKAIDRSSDVDRWTEAVVRAIDSGKIESQHVVGSLLHPKRRFIEWFTSALAESGTSPEACEAQLRQLEETPSGDVAARCRKLRDDLAKLGPDYEEIHARACLIYPARLLEEGAWDEAEEAAKIAIAVARHRRDRGWELIARRLVVGAMLARLEIAPAFQELDEILASKPAARSKEEELLAKIFGESASAGPVLHTKRFFTGLGGLEEAKRDVAFHVQCVTGDDDEEWRGALEKLAKHAKGRNASLIRARLRR